MMKFFKIFVVANVTVVTTLTLLPAFLITGDVTIIEELIESISVD